MTYTKKVNQISCKTAMSQSGLPGLDYALNPYRGCTHACVYCYAPFVLREAREWGAFVDVKHNIPRILESELQKKEKGVVGIGTVTDAYQPIEKNTGITRGCLEVLLKYDFPISIQTKSDLILRDLELIKKFSTKDVGMTLTTFDDALCKIYEPHSSSVKERLDALARLHSEGIETWAFLGPIMPHITDEGGDLEKLIDALARAGVKLVMVDKLNLKRGMWTRIENFLEGYDRALVPEYKEILFSKNEYFEKVKKEMIIIFESENMKYEFLF